MVPEAIVLALIVGLIFRGKLTRLADIKIRYIWLIFVALGLSLAAREFRELVHQQTVVNQAAKIVQFLLLLFVGAANTRIAGVKLMMAGLVANLAAILANGGVMPVSEPGMTIIAGKNLPELLARYPFVKDMLVGPHTRLAALCDIYPAYHPYVLFQSVYSLGDFITTIGCFIAIVAIMRGPAASRQKLVANEA